MTDNDIKDFSLLMAMLAEIFLPVNSSLSETKVELYFDLLKEYSISDIKLGVTKILKSHIYNSFPKPAEIIKEIEGDQGDVVIEKWLLLKDTIAKVGAYQSVQFEDLVINSVINELGGWSKVCEVLEDDLKWMQKDFERLYPILKKRVNHPKYILGIADQENNNRNNYIESKPILIKNRKNKLQLNYENNFNDLPF